MKALLFAASVPMALALQFATWSLESWVAMKVWTWHVGSVPFGLTLWQLIWVNAAVSCIVRQYVPRPNTEDPYEVLLNFGRLLLWSASPLVLLAMAWFLK